MTIEIGSWVIPLFFTALAFAVSRVMAERHKSPPPDIYRGVLYLTATSVSLVAWLIWALVS